VQIDLAEYKGKVVLLDFWATWCGPCIAELPHVQAAYEKYHGKGFEIIGISLDRDRAALEKFIADRKMTWRQHWDEKNEVAGAYGVRSIPSTWLIAPDGKVAAVGLRGEQLGRRLARFYPEPKAAAPEQAGK
jgi:thiol-disulfide isomerase/thioredoxin